VKLQAVLADTKKTHASAANSVRLRRSRNERY
jgi:hypothetical protein